MILLYVPPVQNFIRKQATAIASDATGMNISVERIDLRFPLNLLVRGVQVVQPGSDTADIQHPDTLLNLGSLNVRVQAWPLLKGRVEVDDITLQRVAVNSSGLLEGMRIKGTLGRFFLASHGIDLNKEDAVLNRVELSDTHVQVMLADTTETPEDTTETALNWRVALHNLKLKNVSVDLQMPLDSMSLAATIGDASIEDAKADLKRQFYGWRKFALTGTSVNYDTGTAVPAEGFDASHIALRDIRIGIDSVMTCGRDMNAVIREFSMYDRSGLTVTSLTGRLFADSAVIRVPYLELKTPHSEMNLTAQTYWKLVDIPTTGQLSARFNANIGKQDVLLFAGGLPETFKEAYPFRPLVIHAGTEGNLKQMQISRFTAELPGAFSLSGGGELWNLTDSLKRSGGLDFEMQTQDLNFLTGLTGVTPDGSIVVPDSMNLVARLGLDGPQCNALLKVQEGKGSLNLDAAYNLSTEVYHADLAIDALQLHHFLPKDSVYVLTAHVAAKGRGVDMTSRQTTALVEAKLDELQYARWNLSGVNLNAGLKSAVASVRLTSDNELLKMQSEADLRLDRKYMDGRLNMKVEELDLYNLGIASEPLEHPVAFNLGVEARRDSIKLRMDAGDMDLQFRARSTLEELLGQSDKFVAILTKQIEERRLDHAALRQVLPSAGMKLTAGQANPVSYFLKTKNIRFNDFTLRFGSTPARGINGRTAVHGLRVDSLQLDTVFFAVKQDTSRMMLQSGVINGPKNPQFVFRSTLTGEIRSEDAELTVNYVDGKGQTGVLFGVNARPLTEGHGKGNGVLLNLTPAEPVIAYRKFHFVDNSNWIYLHNNMRVYANIDMDSDNGLGFRMQSDKNDSISLQNMNVELSRFQLGELSEVLPYMPRLTGLFSAEAQYIPIPSYLLQTTCVGMARMSYPPNISTEKRLNPQHRPHSHSSQRSTPGRRTRHARR